jgi:hypothetical protein
VIGLALGELRSRRVGTALAILGVLTAVLGFVLLAQTARTTTATLSGEVARTWRGPYQLLVRPPAARSELEVRDGLIRPNYFSGLVGGITSAQYETIRDLPGIEVAAPIALIGFVEWPTAWVMNLQDSVSPDGPTVLRLRIDASGESGLSRYPLGDLYLVAASGRVQTAAGRTTLDVGSAVIDCSVEVRCFSGSTLTPPVPQAAGVPATTFVFSLPIVVAGVEPAAEAALAGLDGCVTAGRYLRDADVPTEVGSTAGQQTSIPVLVSTTSFIDETVHAMVARAHDPGLVLSGTRPQEVPVWDPVSDRTMSAEDLYRQFVRAIGSASFYNVSPLWSPAEVAYQVLASDQLRALTVPADPSVFANPLVLATGLDTGPVEARDVWFRQLAARPQLRRDELPNTWLRVGEYDPGCLPSFDQLAGGGGIDAYSLPRVVTPDGKILGPTRSMAGYVNAPPLVLTTLAGARWFADPKRFNGAPGAAFISAIRVRVAGAAEAGPLAYARLARTAAEIHERTGLAVDIVVGSSPKNVAVTLPAGTFGRPDLVVREGWSVTGVAYTFSRALQVQDFALFAVALVGALALVAQTAFVSVRRRRSEFAVLRAFGWRGSHLGVLVLLEVMVIGVVAGALGLALSVPLGMLISGGPSGLIFLVAPLAVLVSIVGGVVPAIAATRTRVVRALVPVPTTGGRMPDQPWAIGLVEMMRRRGRESLIGVAVLALAGTLLGAIVAVEIGFRGQLDVTLLGTYVATQVEPFHVIVALLTLGIGALAAAQIVTLQYLERQPELATLRALGWRSANVAAFVAGAALALGVIGGGVAAVLVTLLMLLLGPTPQDLLIAVVAALLSPAIAVSVAVSAILAHAYRLSPAQLLRGE